MNNQRLIVLVLVILLTGCKAPIKTSKFGSVDSKSPSIILDSVGENILVKLLKSQNDQFRSIMENPDYKIQVVYSQIDRNEDGKAQFHDYYYRIDDSNYFYPASTVKLPVAALALQKLNELQVKDLDKNSMMISEATYSGQTEVYNDPSSADGNPSIAHYIKKILLVSDNDAYNRLYEFLGQEYINNSLHNMGYTDVQIIHRLEISLTEDENRHTNPVKFFDTSGKLVYEKPLEESRMTYAARDTKLGKGFYRSSEMINEPFDFSKKNRMTLKTLHNIVRSILFPESVPEKQRFNLTEDDYVLLRRYMSMTPPESDFPYYEKENYWDNYVKFLFYGAEKEKSMEGVRVFNKPGDAYGFLTDAAYIVDFKNNIEFLVAATIYCNSDGILNDNKYDYEEIGLPFMKKLGRKIYEFELNRKRKVKPTLSHFQFDYGQ